VKSKKAEINNYYIEQSWSVSLKNIGRQNFEHNSHRTQSNPIQSNPIQSMDESNPWTSLSHRRDGDKNQRRVSHQLAIRQLRRLGQIITRPSLEVA